MSTFAEQVAAALLGESSALGARWQAQARAVAPRAPGRVTPAAGSGVVSPAHRAALAAAAESAPAMVHAVACALHNAPRCQDGVLRAGWHYGSAAHLAGAALHHVVKELDLLAAMALYVAERTAEEGAGRADAGAAEGVRVTRRLHRAFATLRLAASKGYTHAAGEELRGRYRALRHDLRNPLGTIRSAVALMEDESLPAEVRYSARYRAMVVRNTTSLDDLIGAGLGDAATDLSTLVLQEVSLRDVALAVRRDMREEAEGAACAIEVAPTLGPPTLPALVADSAAFELALRSVLSVALARARGGSTIGVALHVRRAESVVIAVSFEPSDPPPGATIPAAADDAFSFAETIARRAGGRVWRESGGRVLLEIPAGEIGTSPTAMAAGGAARAGDRAPERGIDAAAGPVDGDRPGGGAPPPLRSVRHAGDDLAGATQRDHG